MTFALKIELARQCLNAGGVIAYPTEGVWGLGCDPNNPDAVAKLLQIKHRPVEKGLILVAAEISQFEPYLQQVSSEQRRRLEAGWPGPITWLVPDNGTVPSWIRGQHQAVALRVSAHSLVAELCRAVGGPIVSSSANIATRPAAKWCWQVARNLPDVDYIVHGELGGRTGPSEIRELVADKVVRKG